MITFIQIRPKKYSMSNGQLIWNETWKIYKKRKEKEQYVRNAYVSHFEDNKSTQKKGFMSGNTLPYVC